MKTDQEKWQVIDYEVQMYFATRKLRQHSSFQNPTPERDCSSTPSLRAKDYTPGICASSASPRSKETFNSKSRQR